MPLARAIPRILAAIAFGWASVSCADAMQTDLSGAAADADATGSTPISTSPLLVNVPTGPTARMPSELRTGQANMAIQPVERNVLRAEVAAAVQRMIRAAPICDPMPGLWLEPASRRGAWVVRLDLMARDWGQDVADDARARVAELITLGYFVKRERPDVGPGVIEISITNEGRDHMRGSIETGQSPQFCAPAERRLVEITSMEWGRFPCGTLHVRFTHTADAWPSWANNDASRARLAAEWPALGEVMDGEVTVSRQWFRRSIDIPDDVQNGALRSLCYDSDHRRVVGDDLNLFATPPEAAQ